LIIYTRFFELTKKKATQFCRLFAAVANQTYNSQKKLDDYHNNAAIEIAALIINIYKPSLKDENSTSFEELQCLSD